MMQENIKNKKGYIMIQAVTLARIPLAIIFSIILLTGKNSSLNLILCLFMLALIEISDAFDGIIARKFYLVSEYGAALDPYADSISRLLVYSSLAASNRVLLLLPLCMALRDVTVAYSRIIMAKKNISVSAKKSGKIKAMFQATGAFCALLGPYYWSHIGNWSFYALSWVIIIVTLLSSIEYITTAILALKK
jgi:CDP-diacylglycerol--glycerol-3-phosphate 3-phosphatidyltransferase